MVAILMAAVLGSVLSTLLLAKFGILVVLLAMPLAGSAAGLIAALGLAAAKERHLSSRTAPTMRPIAISRYTTAR